MKIISGKKLIKVLNEFGFEVVRIKGSHARLKKKTKDKIIVTVVPLHKELDVGTVNAILKQCELDKSIFEK